jgi:hypothetical protein
LASDVSSNDEAEEDEDEAARVTQITSKDRDCDGECSAAWANTACTTREYPNVTIVLVQVLVLASFLMMNGRACRAIFERAVPAFLTNREDCAMMWCRRVEKSEFASEDGRCWNELIR